MTTIADRIYTSMDRRLTAHAEGGAQEPKLGWPGVSYEIWGAHGAFGGEGYGWGAVAPAHIIRSILGIRETDGRNRIMICPNLPDSLVHRGGQCGLAGLPFGLNRLSLQYEVLKGHQVRVTGQREDGLPIRSVMDGAHHPVEVQKVGAGWQFIAANHGQYDVSL